jgi:hypothetical protein
MDRGHMLIQRADPILHGDNPLFTTLIPGYPLLVELSFESVQASPRGCVGFVGYGAFYQSLLEGGR